MDKKMITLEICCGSFEDALAAQRGGADRIELNSALFLGGLTPGMGTLKRVKAELTIPAIAMVRPRGGGFCYTEEEKKTMLAEASALLEAGADGLAFGFLKEDREINREWTKEMTDLIHSWGRTAVFHRAVDCTPDYLAAFGVLTELGIDRALTSGGRATAPEGQAEIAKARERFGDQMEILAGSGVNSRTVRELLLATGVTQIHSSCRDWRRDNTTEGRFVSYAYAPEPHALDYEYVSEILVRELSKQIEI